jgi:hypothetical protein
MVADAGTWLRVPRSGENTGEPALPPDAVSQCNVTPIVTHTQA